MCIAQRGRLPTRILKEERFSRAGRPDRCAVVDSALRQVAGNHRRGRLRKSRRIVSNAEAPVQVRVRHLPKHQTRPCALRRAIHRNVNAPRRLRPRRRISRVLRSVPDQIWVNTRGVAELRRRRSTPRRAWSRAHQPLQGVSPTERSKGQGQAMIASLLDAGRAAAGNSSIDRRPLRAALRRLQCFWVMGSVRSRRHN